MAARHAAWTGAAAGTTVLLLGMMAAAFSVFLRVEVAYVLIFFVRFFVHLSCVS